MRQLSEDQVSLDDVMKILWAEYLEQEGGIAEDRIQQLVNETLGQDLSTAMKSWIYGTDDLPLAGLLEAQGVNVEVRVTANTQDKGGKPVEGELPQVDFGAVLKDGDGGLTVQRVAENGAAQQAGLAAGDVIVAFDGLRLNLSQAEKRLLRAQPGDRWHVHAFRRDELHHVTVELPAAVANTFVLQASEKESQALLAWLHS